MKSNIFLQVIISIGVLFCCFIAWAAPVAQTEAIMFANTKGKELLDTFQEKNLAKRYQTLDNLILKSIDLDYISKFVVGKYWRIMDPAQRQKYQEIFKRYGLAYYKTLPLDFANNLSYEILGASPDGKFTNVFTVVHIKLEEQPQDINLVFRLHETSGSIKAVDVKIAESSMLLAYRSKFYEMIAKNDEEIDWFLEDLEDTTKSWEESLK